VLNGELRVCGYEARTGSLDGLRHGEVSVVESDRVRQRDLSSRAVPDGHGLRAELVTDRLAAFGRLRGDLGQRDLRTVRQRFTGGDRSIGLHHKLTLTGIETIASRVRILNGELGAIRHQSGT